MPGHAVLCHPGRTSSSRGWGCGAVFCCSPAAAWMELPGNCRVEARREQSGNCRDPRSSISARTPWAVRPSKGHGVTCCVPPSRCHHPSPELPQGRGFARGMDPEKGTGTREKGTGTCWPVQRVQGGAERTGHGQDGCSAPRRSGAGGSAPGKRHIWPCPAPEPAPARRGPFHPGRRRKWGGLAATPTCPPCPRGNPAPEGCQAGGSRTHPRPFPTLRWVQRAGLGVRGWSPQSWGCAPRAGDTGEGQCHVPPAWHGGTVRVCGGDRARGCEAERGCGAVPPVAMCDSGG